MTGSPGHATVMAAAGVSALLDRAVRCCAARLVQTAYESCEREPELPRYAAGELQLALNIFANPDRARDVVLGLPREAAGARTGTGSGDGGGNR